MPELSIIVPVYNAGEYLIPCINSILSSSFHDFELLLVDNASTDSSAEVCRSFAEADSRVRALYEGKKGVSAARNCGLAAAKGTFIGFADSDDTIEPELYQTLMELCCKNGVDMAACGIYVDKEGFPPEGQNITGREELFSPVEAADFAMSGRGYKGFLVNKLFKRQILVENHIQLDVQIGYCEDLLFVLTYLSHVSGMTHYRSVPLYHYRIHGGNVSEGVFSEKLYSGMKSFAQIEQLVKGNWPTLQQQASASIVGMAIYTLKAIARSGGATPEQQQFLTATVRSRAGDYLAQKSISRRAKLLCRLCRFSPPLFMLLIRRKDR